MDVFTSSLKSVFDYHFAFLNNLHCRIQLTLGNAIFFYLLYGLKFRPWKNDLILVIQRFYFYFIYVSMHPPLRHNFLLSTSSSFSFPCLDSSSPSLVFFIRSIFQMMFHREFLIHVINLLSPRALPLTALVISVSA